ncbi:hypothetical protein [Jiulongibacter sediminis]|jgi:hypothetical protein|uniref:hypothetical protein n=1 Tax=Jiulongibacter sediminis TaxID=1605367 RepID=UPI0026EE6CFB|nr:hypothetical protein [Jiulongibacter sediminis]
MKKLLALLSIVFLVSCQSQVPFSGENASLATQHQKLAILPFKVTFNEEYKQRPQRFNARPDAEYWREQERLAGLDMQKELFMQMAHQVERGRYERVIQDFNTTNQLLEQAGVRFYDIQGAAKGNLARMLGVDALIYGETEIVVTPPMMGFSNSRDGAYSAIVIYDAGSGQPVWQEDVSQRPSNQMDTPKRLADDTARSLAKMLPY